MLHLPYMSASLVFSLSACYHKCNDTYYLHIRRCKPLPGSGWQMDASILLHDISYESQNVNFMGHSTALILMEMFRLWWSVTISSVCIISCFLSEQNTSRNPLQSLDRQRKTRGGLKRNKLRIIPPAHWIVITMQNFTTAPWHQPVECGLTV